ncbi:ATP-binding protein [Actinoplanes sp. L3-i22]|uniref:ATP-binding protein n=1 Tax=Actinoplanes sp. L3-i22 TaxID=2836373 RepID=UPI0021082F68|nr:ATP-binding protein [Actinoplanes sp. L3-i22]
MRRPPVFDEELARWTIAGAPELQFLRAELQRAAMSRSATAADGEDLAERLQIVATELAGNALRHGRPPTVVVLHRSNGKLVIDVLDGDAESGPAVADRRAAGAGGLGLLLSERLAEQVGWYPTGDGKLVWASFALPAR